MAGVNINGTPTAREFQQNIAERAVEKFWDLLSKDQGDILVQKLQKLVPDPVPPSDSSDTPREKKSREKQIVANERIRMTIFNAVWSQRKYTNGQSLTSVIYVLVVSANDSTKVEKNIDRVEDCQSFSCHPVLRSRRCVNGTSSLNRVSSNCCMIFVDENGRVYQNWASYVATNTLPAGVMVAPERGIYQMSHGQVRLDKYKTPAGKQNKKMLRYLDIGSAMACFGAPWVEVAALTTLPFVAHLNAVVGTVGFTTAIYSVACSSVQLVDLRQHGQLIRRNEITGVLEFRADTIISADVSPVDEVGTVACNFEGGACTTAHLMVRSNIYSEKEFDALEQRSVVVGGEVFALKDYGPVLFEYIDNVNSFENVIAVMAECLEPAVFGFIMELTQTFLDSMVAELALLLKFLIPTESVLYRIKTIILENYSDASYEVIIDHSTEILSAARAYYIALSPNPVTEEPKKCDICEGYFTVSMLRHRPSLCPIYTDDDDVDESSFDFLPELDTIYYN